MNEPRYPQDFIITFNCRKGESLLPSCDYGSSLSNLDVALRRAARTVGEYRTQIKPRERGPVIHPEPKSKVIGAAWRKKQ